MDALNLQGLPKEDRPQFLEAVYVYWTQIIEAGDPQKIPGAYLMRGRVSLMRKDFEAAARDFAVAKVSEGPVMFAAAKELTLIDRYKAEGPLVPGVAAGPEIVAQYLAQEMEPRPWGNMGHRLIIHRAGQIQSWSQWCESHGLDLLCVSEEDFIPWLAETYPTYSPRRDALDTVIGFYEQLVGKGHIKRSPLFHTITFLARAATQMAATQGLSTGEQQASL